MRVEEPMLSMVATRLRADSLSGASVPSARQAPLELVDLGDQPEDGGGDLDAIGVERALGHARIYTQLHPIRQPNSTPEYTRMGRLVPPDKVVLPRRSTLSSPNWGPVLIPIRDQKPR